MILRSLLPRKTIFTAVLALLFSSTLYGQYAATDYYYMDDNQEWESVLGGNPDLSFEIFEEDNKAEYTTKQSFYNNGHLAEEITFKNNKEAGEAKFYHPNGQLAMSGNFKDGAMVGLWKFFNEDGHIPSGDWQWNFVNSDEVKVKGQLLYGKPYGTWTYKTQLGRSSEFKITFE